MKSKDEAREMQTGIVLVTHVDYGSALLRATEHILGPISDCATLQVDINNEVDETVKRLQEAARRLDSGMGVLVLTDMFGGTPTNLSLSLLGQGDLNIEVLTGVNLPMLLKVLSNRQKTLKELADIACEAGREGILVAGEILRNKTKKSAIE